MVNSNAVTGEQDAEEVNEKPPFLPEITHENPRFGVVVNNQDNTPKTPVNNRVNLPTVDDAEEGLGCGTYELQIHRRDVPVDAELEEFINSQLNFSVPTQSLINLLKRRDTVKTQKARAKTDRRLNEFERAEVLQGFDNKQAALTLAIEKARNQVKKEKTEKE